MLNAIEKERKKNNAWKKTDAIRVCKSEYIALEKGSEKKQQCAKNPN